MKKIFLLVSLLILFIGSYGQSKVIEKIKASVNKDISEAHLTFLAADEMRGRNTGSPELAIAAKYIATQFKLYGVKTIEGAPGYYQPVGLQKTLPPQRTDFKIGNDLLKFKDDVLLLKGDYSVKETGVVFVGYGNEKDFEGIDVTGKIVVAYTGSSEQSSPQVAFLEDSPAKLKRVMEKGGAALVEIVSFQQLPWQALVGFLGGSRTTLQTVSPKGHDFPHVWIRKSEVAGVTELITKKAATGSLTIELTQPKKFNDNNVVGVIEGTDPVLKKEYVVLSAHYDHIGVKKNASGDSIYNGARDNATGTTAILNAASFFTKNPPKRSLIIMALCAEEVGLFGSEWYVESPLIPLNQTVYDLDCDGAGYNDKTFVTLIDVNRTTADDHIKKGCEAFGLGLKGDPEPTQNLYERSDNYNFAKKGIPAVDFSPGVKGFDQELMKYYHQPPDEVGSLDFDYLEKYFRAFVYTAYLISNSPERPQWKAGDKFEAAGKKLYGK